MNVRTLISLIADLSEKQVNADMEREERERVAAGGLVLNATSSAEFLRVGLEIEDAQYVTLQLSHSHQLSDLTPARRKLITVVRALSKNISVLSHSQQANVTEQRSVLQEKLHVWIQLRSIYLPGLLQLLSDLNEAPPIVEDGHPEDVKLWLPSHLPPNRRRAACFEGLPKVESRLRMAQCNDSLDEVRYMLRVKTRMIQFKNQNVRGQREGVRSRAVISRVHEKLMGAVRRYRDGRDAYLELSRGNTVGADSGVSLRELKDEDVRSYRDPTLAKLPGSGRVGTNEDTINGEAVVQSVPPLPPVTSNATTFLDAGQRGARDGTGETYKSLSWIWTTGRTLQINDETDSDDRVLRAEWCKSRARGNRATEEVFKVQEEMRRTLKYLEWKAAWWITKVDERTEGIKGDLSEALRAYALEQSSLQLALHASFKTIWGKPLIESLEELPFVPRDEDDGADEDSEGEGEGEESEIEEEFEDDDETSSSSP